MNPFESATIDMMTNPDFGEVCYIGGSTTSVTCVCSELSEAEIITEFGDDAGESFYLRIEKRLLSAAPKKYDRIMFRGVTFKVDRVDLDSAGLVYRVYLKSLSSRSS